MVDAWQVSIADIGPSGEDRGRGRGRGGKYLFVPQGWDQPLRDSAGELFKSSETYRLRVPAHVPVDDFWAVVAYDLDSKSYAVRHPPQHPFRRRSRCLCPSGTASRPVGGRRQRTRSGAAAAVTRGRVASITWIAPADHAPERLAELVSAVNRVVTQTRGAGPPRVPGRPHPARPGTGCADSVYPPYAFSVSDD
ncbi:DUF1214 domain-containing protein [Streptomyces sp. NBC_00448]|uniref:DUF1214 domain-containing protein n=1 Tax=Streptomyces sp. NBC_00448 TaxID=2903652 RepID=UPI002E1E62B8